MDHQRARPAAHAAGGIDRQLAAPGLVVRETGAEQSGRAEAPIRTSFRRLRRERERSEAPAEAMVESQQQPVLTAIEPVGVGDEVEVARSNDAARARALGPGEGQGEIHPPPRHRRDASRGMLDGQHVAIVDEEARGISDAPAALDDADRQQGWHRDG